MAQDEVKNDPQDTTAADPSATDVINEAAAQASAAEAGDATKAEIEALKLKLARWQADYQNLQRRAAREVLESKANADADFAKSMLQVLDHFDMALSVDPAKADAKTVLEGIKITYDELKKVLAVRGIESFDPAGKPFDPHAHEAVMQEQSDKHPPMTVTQTFQQGYKIGERVLRPAKVKVSR